LAGWTICSDPRGIVETIIPSAIGNVLPIASKTCRYEMLSLRLFLRVTLRSATSRTALFLTML
jgi:hypothetical protein